MNEKALSAIDGFCQKIAATLESDYGDWMREANLAFIELRQTLEPLADASVHERLQDLQDLIQFKSNGWPLSTCRMALMLANDLRSHWAEFRPLELHSYGLSWSEHETPQIAAEYRSVGVDVP